MGIDYIRKLFAPIELKDCSFLHFVSNFKEHFGTDKITETEEHADTFTLKSKNSLIYQNYAVSFKLNEENKTVSYTTDLSEISRNIIIVLIFAAFFSKYSFTNYLMFGFSFSAIFYVANFIFINNKIRTAIDKSMHNAPLVQKEETISLLQKEWIENAEKCPGCGHSITIYNQYCPDCGLKVRDMAKLTPWTVSKYQKQGFYYSQR